MSLLSPPLQAFIAIAQYKTVHGAAEAIHLTQTAVTQRIRSLERQLKTTLFIRSRRGMQLTPEGEALLRYCQAAQTLEGEALAHIQGAGQQTEIELTISAPTSIMRSRIIPSCIPVMQQFPFLRLHFDVDDVEHRHQRLRSGDVDIVILRDSDCSAEMQTQALAPEQYVLVASQAWQGRNLKDIVANENIIDFDETDQVTFDYLKHYSLFEHTRHNRYFVNRTDHLAFMVSNAIGYTTLAKEFAMPYVEKGDLTILNHGKTLDTTPYLAWFDRPEPPAYFSALIKSIIDQKC